MEKKQNKCCDPRNFPTTHNLNLFYRYLRKRKHHCAEDIASRTDSNPRNCKTPTAPAW